jgi:hypothetical protein
LSIEVYLFIELADHGLPPPVLLDNVSALPVSSHPHLPALN